MNSFAQHLVIAVVSGFTACQCGPDLNLVLDGGEASQDELVANVGRGLLVTDFWYTRVLDPRTIVVTGLTRNGVWLVEDGRIVRPVTNLRFTQSFVDAMGPGAVKGVGSDQTLVGGATFGFGPRPITHHPPSGTTTVLLPSTFDSGSVRVTVSGRAPFRPTSP